MTQTLIKSGHLWGHGVADLLIDGNTIIAIAANLPAPEGSCEVIDARNKFIYPGFVNTHHHLTQTLAKAMPAGINSDLNHWLGAVPYALLPKITPEVMYHSAVVGFYELLRSGCTTCADHFYIYHQDFNPELEAALYQAAEDTGIRFVHCRGGSTHLGTHRGTSKARQIPEDIDLFLKRLDETRSRHHQTASDAMHKLVAAPTSIVHTSPPEDLRQIAAYARQHQLRMHSHLLEVPFDNEAAQTRYGLSAIDYAEAADWLGPDVWFAHLVHADSSAIAKLAATGTGIAHCPTSNCRLGSGIAPAALMANQGMTVSLGVDGSASAESASMMNEMLLAWLIHRAVGGPEATTVEQVFDWASINGARLLGYDTLGKLEAGWLADFSIINLDQPRFWGVWEKPWAPVTCGEPIAVEQVFVNGRRVLNNGQVGKLDWQQLQNTTQQLVSQLMAGD
ncbi:amidohydrolase family protein [Halioxenophilus sp. WMMB6]|uniref:amidohydrolase family protein n=1 Tax=Halioxenophilus sp. WMMB6 TaxID=3073815 RepID=UPI00295E5B0F|nr:amidohydrolase family protein [Halioxenophilus sp. WMMB6]